MNNIPVITSTTVLSALMEKHKYDVCVPECKTGETWTAHGCPRMDLWVMARSWAHPRTIGYEIKVSRQDFLHDNKWPQYLDYCKEFYFACPRGVIDPGELPAEAGLLVLSGTRMIVKKKAPVRSVEIPEKLYRYILMRRC